jgi:hypothetical protein
MQILKDKSLQKELDIINILLKQKTEAFEKNSDDWQFVQQ